MMHANRTRISTIFMATDLGTVRGLGEKPMNRQYKYFHLMKKDYWR